MVRDSDLRSFTSWKKMLETKKNAPTVAELSADED